MALGRYCVRSMPLESVPQRPNSARRSPGSSRFRMPMAAGARTPRATSSTIAAMSRRRARPPRPPGRYSGLMAAGQVEHPAVARGIEYLMDNAGQGRFLARAALHCDRVSARVLSALPWVLRIFPAVGARTLPQLESVGFPLSRLRDVASYRRPQPPSPQGLGGEGAGGAMAMAWNC